MLIPGKPVKPGACADPLRTPLQERELLRDLARKAEEELMAQADAFTWQTAEPHP